MLLPLLLACADDDLDLTGDWLVALYADDSTWASGLFALEDDAGTLGGNAQLGAGGEVVIDWELVGEHAKDTLTLSVDAPDARYGSNEIFYHLDFTADVVGADEVSGTFTALAGVSGEEQDWLEGRAGTWMMGPAPTE